MKTTLNYDSYCLGTQLVLDQSQLEQGAYWHTVKDIRFLVLKGVFSPKYFTDTEFFINNFPPLRNKSFLEIGPGIGAGLVFAKLSGAKEVYGVDINPIAVLNSKLNAELHKLDIRIKQGNVFNSIEMDKSFDYIYWNVPFGLIPEESPITDLQKSVFDPGYKSITKFFSHAHLHLNPEGSLLVGFSDTLGDFSKLIEIATSFGFSEFRKISSLETTEHYPVTMDLYEFKLILPKR